MKSASEAFSDLKNSKESNMVVDKLGALGEKAGELRKDFRELGKIAKEATQEQLEKLQEQGLQQARKVAEEVKVHPISSLLMAAGAGIFLGYLMRSRS